MKKRISFLSVILLFACSVTAQTNVSGFINTNTTWNLTGSPYIIVGNALLSSGYTLTIDPGVAVKFNDSCALQIDGELHAIGTPTNRITFTSNQVNPAPGDWAKIHFSDLCEDALFDAQGNYLSGCIMKYCDVTYGGELGFGEIHIESSSPYFSQCNISNSSNAGIYANNSSHTVAYSTIKNCAGYALYYLFNSGYCEIENDTIANNLAGGIYSGNGWIRVTQNYFVSNLGHGSIDAEQDAERNIFIEGNYFGYNTSNYGIINASIGLIMDTISFNFFEHNQSVDGVINCQWSHSSSPRIFNNCFYNNTCTANGTTVLSLDNVYSYDSTYVFNNKIVNNSGSLSYCFRLRVMINNDQQMNIYNNNFSNNDSKFVIHLSQFFTMNGPLNYLYLKKNNFSNPNSQYELYNNIPYGSQDVYPDSNYWGTVNTQHIDSVIYDYFDYANLSVVYYSPILTSPVAIDTTCSPGSEPTGIVNYLMNHGESATIFPNPFLTNATINFGKGVHHATFLLYNLIGEKVKTVSNINGESLQISRDNLQSGVYIYEVIEKGNKIGRGKAVVY